MPKWILFAALPVLAALLVFGPALLIGDGATTTNPTETESSTTASRRSTIGSSRLSERARPTSSSSELPSGWKVGASMLFVLGIAFGGFWLVRRVQNGDLGSATSRSIEIKESRRLGKGRAIHYVRVLDHLLLIGESETGITLLQDMTPTDASNPSLEFDDEVAEGLHDDLDDDGATPRNLLPPGRNKAKLGDFRELLGRLG